MRKATLACWLVFPVVLGGALAGALVLAPRMGIVAATLAMQILALAAIAACERLWPYVPSWNRSHGDLRTDAIHAIVSGIGVAQLARPLAQLAGAVAAGILSESIGASLWPSGWPLAVQLALALVVVELPQYWLHRWQHERELLWRGRPREQLGPSGSGLRPVEVRQLPASGLVPAAVLGDGLVGRDENGEPDRGARRPGADERSACRRLRAPREALRDRLQWEVAAEAIKAANAVEAFSGEANNLSVALFTSSGFKLIDLDSSSLNLSALIRSLAKHDLVRATDLAKSLRHESPRALA